MFAGENNPARNDKRANEAEPIYKGRRVKTAFIDLFSGIGGFALGAYWAGLRFDRHFFSEIDDYAVQVYKKRFPEAIALGNIREINWSNLCKEAIGEPAQVLVTGGFP